MDARRQAEQAARQQATATGPRSAAEPLAASGDTQGGTNSQNGGATTARQPGPEHLPAGTGPVASSAPRHDDQSSGSNSSPPEADTSADNQAILLSDSELAAMQVKQVRKVDLTRLDARAAHELTEAAQETRRRTIFGGAEDDIVLKMYIDSWRQAVERNAGLDELPLSKNQAHGDSLVTVAVRSDGSIESISINQSSGQPELDAAVRRIAQLSERHTAFPPDLRRRYDVIEIRRVWNFDGKLRILEEAR